MQLVLFRPSHLAPDAAAFWFLNREQAQGDGSEVEQAVLGLTALGNTFIKLYADCTGSPVDSVIRDAAALAYDDPPS